LAVLAGVLGSLAGLIGFAPFFILSGVVRKRYVQRGKGAFGQTLLIPLISFVLMMASMVGCWFLLREFVMIFSISCVIVFLLATGAYTIMQAKSLR